jgi:hypothetical protein
MSGHNKDEKDDTQPIVSDAPGSMQLMQLIFLDLIGEQINERLAELPSPSKFTN